MSSSYSKRKYAGEPIGDKKRSPAPEPPRVPPHKKPRRYKLTVEITTTRTYVYDQEFTTAAAMQEAKARLKKELQEKEKKEEKRSYRKWSVWGTSPFVGFGYREINRIENGPVFHEEQLDD